MALRGHFKKIVSKVLRGGPALKQVMLQVKLLKHCRTDTRLPHCSHGAQSAKVGETDREPVTCDDVSQQAASS